MDSGITTLSDQRTAASTHMQPVAVVQARVAKIATGLGTYFACLAFDRLTGSEDNVDKVRQRAQQLRETLTDLGPSFIKAGQVLANRPDIVREDYMNELCTLQVSFGNSFICSSEYDESLLQSCYNGSEDIAALWCL
eukprot:GHUV01034024.1.p1 GENE.GHUV01034024.1~~GHUV01034024.1.p1  ORF type:complete len:137 (-),score=39.66 GHUV01034024.1:857-1267(-)